MKNEFDNGQLNAPRSADFNESTPTSGSRSVFGTRPLFPTEFYNSKTNRRKWGTSLALGVLALSAVGVSFAQKEKSPLPAPPAMPAPAENGPRPGGPRPEGLRPEGPRPEGARPDGARPEGNRPEGPRPDGARPNGARSDAPPAPPAAEGAPAGRGDLAPVQGLREGGPRDGGPQSEGPRAGGPRLGEGNPRDAAPREGGPREGGPREEGPQSGGPRNGGPRQGGPRESGPHEGGPRPGEGGPREGGPRPEDANTEAGASRALDRAYRAAGDVTAPNGEAGDLAIAARTIYAKGMQAFQSKQYAKAAALAESSSRLNRSARSLSGIKAPALVSVPGLTPPPAIAAPAPVNDADSAARELNHNYDEWNQGTSTTNPLGNRLRSLSEVNYRAALQAFNAKQYAEATTRARRGADQARAARDYAEALAL